MSIQIEVIGIFLTFLGIVCSFVFYTSSVNKKLKILLERENGVLNRQQAKTLMEIYIDILRTDIEREARYFFEQELPNIIGTGNQHSIDKFVDGHTDTITRARGKISLFRITGNQSFKEFIEQLSPLHGGILAQTKNDLKCSLRIDDIKNDADIERKKKNIHIKCKQHQIHCWTFLNLR